MLAAAITLAMAIMTQARSAVPPPPPPPEFVSDYMPGPWFVPIDPRTARPLAETIPIIDGIADAARRLPEARVTVCMSFALDERASKREERRRFAQFLPILFRKGVDSPRAGRARDCALTESRRDVPGVMVFVGPRSR